MYVSEISNKLKVSPDTIRYYTRIGLVTPTKGANGYKRYSEGDFRKLRFTLRAKTLGFSLADIKALIGISDRGETPCPAAREIISRNLEKISQSIEESQILLTRIKAAAAVWPGLPNNLSDGEVICSLIESWDEEDAE